MELPSSRCHRHCLKAMYDSMPRSRTEVDVSCTFTQHAKTLWRALGELRTRTCCDRLRMQWWSCGMFSELLLVRSGVTNQQIQLAYLHDQMVAHRGPVCECCSFQKSSSTTLDLSFTTPMLSNTAYARVREFMPG